MAAKKKKKSPQENPVPKLFRKPLIPAMIMLGLDVLALAAAAVLRGVAEKTAQFTCVEGGIVTHTAADSISGVVMAVLLALAAADTAFMIAGSVIRANRDGVFPVWGILGALLLAAASVGIMVFAIYYSGDRPKQTKFIGFEDDLERHIVITEQDYGRYSRLRVFVVKPDNTALLTADVELTQLSEDIDSRYNIGGTGESKIEISFTDLNSAGMEIYRSISFDYPDMGE